MKQQKFLAAALAGLLLTGCAGCAAPDEEKAGKAPGKLSVMTWNVHNLFDGEDNGYEYDEFLKSQGWSAEKYLGRINAISDAIGRIQPQPDIILLQEIESGKVLEDLSRSLNGGYSQSHFAANPGAAVGVGIISKYPLSDVKAHSVTVESDTAPRPVLEARIEAKDARSSESFQGGNISQKSLAIFICHWKSKLGGDEATESTRRASARVILRRVRELRETEPELGIIIAGDLNQNYDEFYRQNAEMICALLPDDPYCALLAAKHPMQLAEKFPWQQSLSVQKDFIVISKNMPPVPDNFPPGTITFYSPWIRELEDGSYYYKNNWETIDHFLVSHQLFDDTGWEYEKTAIVNIPPFANESGIPAPYSSRTGLGMSDHLPLMLFLAMKD